MNKRPRFGVVLAQSKLSDIPPKFMRSFSTRYDKNKIVENRMMCDFARTDFRGTPISYLNWKRARWINASKMTEMDSSELL